MTEDELAEAVVQRIQEIIRIQREREEREAILSEIMNDLELVFGDMVIKDGEQ